MKKCSEFCWDCKYNEQEKCTHPYADACEHCEMWWPKEDIAPGASVDGEASVPME